MFVDASAIVAIVGNEADKHSLRSKLATAERVYVSAISIYEASLALARLTGGPLAEAREFIMEFVRETDAKYLDIDKSIGGLALEAFERFGKGRHRAQLNMGDCFAYACAKAHGVRLLCKGDDFIHTDIAIA